jgi:hypothetical protein
VCSGTVPCGPGAEIGCEGAGEVEAEGDGWVGSEGGRGGGLCCLAFGCWWKVVCAWFAVSEGVMMCEVSDMTGCDLLQAESKDSS